MSGGECDIGKNGCVAVQDVKSLVGEHSVMLQTQDRQIDDLWKAVSDIRGLLIKAVIGIAGLTAMIQVIFKFWHN